MKEPSTGQGGSIAALSTYREIWLIDFEFRAWPGKPPRPVCMAAREFRTGRLIRLWRDNLVSLRRPPFDIGPESLVVAYYASAELGCFLALGWPMPAHILDLYVEHRCRTNGAPTGYGNGLLGALTWHGLAHMDAGDKDRMRRLILDNIDWSLAEQSNILDYCQSDVDALAALLPKMVPDLDMPRAGLRGRYMAAVARMEWNGVPIDVALHTRLSTSWDTIKDRLIGEVDQAYGVYEGRIFKTDRFADYLVRQDISWPRLPSGALALDDDTFKGQALLRPELEPLRQLRSSLGKLRLNELPIGEDQRNRCLLSPFASVTGRNQPSNSRFVFGPSRWIRGLIKPPEGYGLAYIDFASQEIGIAAGLSGDGRMIEGYTTGDPYLAFAKAAGLAPPDAVKASHKEIRDRCKAVVLGVNYGMSANALATSLGIAPAEARELMRLHRETYRRFWCWSDEVVSSAMLTNRIQAVYGWQCRIVENPNPRAIMNFPMQANGAEMLRLAAIAATEAGIEVCAPVHDAFLIAAPLDRLDEHVATMREIMAKAGQAVTGGLDIRTDAEIVRWPDRYMDERGEAMWTKVMGLIETEANI